MHKKGGTNLGNKVLIDNMSLQSASALLSGYGESTHRYYSKTSLRGAIDCINNLLTAILFFEKLSFFDNGFQHGWTHSITGKKLDGVIDAISLKDEVHADIILKCQDKMLELDCFSEKCTVTNGALEYYYISNYLEHNYFPSPSRSSFLNKNNIQNLNKRIALDYMDNKIKQEIIKINDEIGSNVFNIEMPMVLNYIMSQVDSKESIIDTSLELRANKKVRNIREWLIEVDSFVENGNIIGLKKILSSIDELIHEFTKEFNNSKDDEACQITLSLTPSLTIPIKNKFWEKQESRRCYS